MVGLVMISDYEEPELRADLEQKLRSMADGGATVRQLVETIQCQLDLNGDAVIPVLAYFVKAFRVPLLDVLPIREWLGTTNDEEINALVLPALEKTKDRWGATKRRTVAT